MKYPLIALSLSFICGILFAVLLHLHFILLLVLSFIFISSGFFLARKKSNYVLFAIMLASFFIGAARFTFQNESEVSPLFDDYFVRDIGIYGTISSCDIPITGKLIFSIKCDSIKTKHHMLLSSKKLIVTLYEDSTSTDFHSSNLKPGDRVYLLGNYYRFKDEGNPYEFDELAFYAGAGYAGRLRINKPDSINIIGSESALYEKTVYGMRKGLDKRLRTYFNDETYGVLRGLILADRKGLKTEETQAFADAGVIHTLAVSGLHIGFIAFILSILFARLGKTRKDIATIIGIFIFLCLIGFVTSASRAGLMIGLYLTGRILQRDPNPVHAVFVSALIILIIDPNELLSIGFQLSYSAVLGILFYFPLLESLLKIKSIKNKFLRLMAISGCISLAAQIGVMPFILFYFGKMPLLAPFANIVVIPLIGLVLIGGALTLTISILSDYLAQMTAVFTEYLMKLLNTFIEFFASLDRWSLAQPELSLTSFFLLMFLVVILYFILRSYIYSPRLKVILALGIVLLIFLYPPLFQKKFFNEPVLTVLCMDVGQGDAIFVRTPEGKTLLIDGGQLNKYVNTAHRRIIPFFDKTGIETVDLAIISHYDADHYGGIVGLLNKKRITHLLVPEEAEDLIVDDEITALAALRGIKTTVVRDTVLNLGSLKIFIFSVKNDSIFSTLSSNDRSISVKLQYGNTSFLFTGDAGFRSESFLIEKYGNFLQADVLKAGHHGSKSSTGSAFLELVKPAAVVFSCGLGNRYNHPAPEVIQRVSQVNARYFRTDTEGAIVFKSNGKEIKRTIWK